MKKYLLTSLLSAMLACSNLHASEADVRLQDTAKVETIKRLYQTAIQKQAKNPALPDYSVISSFANEPFKKAIKQLDKVSQRNEDCAEAMYNVKLIEGNGYDFSDVTHANFTVNASSGRIVSQLFMPDGNLSMVEFAVSCQQNQACKIDDMFDQTGISAMSAIKKYCSRK